MSLTGSVALSGIIGGLGGIYGEFPGAPPVSVFNAPPTETGTNEKISTNLTGPSPYDVVQATVEAASTTRVISDFVASLPDALPVETLKACQVNPETITTAMSVQPNSASFSGTRDETKPFLIRGGAFPYIITLMGIDSDLVAVRQTTNFGPAFTITIKNQAPPGLYTIHVADSSHRTATLPLEVVGPRQTKNEE